MDFIIYRTSTGFVGEQKPIEECKEKFIFTYPSDFSNEYWIIKINTLEELLKLQEKYGKLIINEDFELNRKTIEIYDDYRE